MTFAGLIDLVACAAMLAAIAFLVMGWSETLRRDAKIFLGALFLTLFLNSLGNALTWLGITQFAESHEHYLEILQPILWMLFVYAALQDVSSDALRRSEQRYALAQRAADIGTWEWDILSDSIEWSDNIEPMFGYSPGDFSGTYEGFLERIHPADRDLVNGAVDAAIRGERDYQVDHRIVWPDGTVRRVLETGDVIRDEQRRPIRMLGVVQDITDLKRAEEERRRLEREVQNAQKLESLGVLAGGIAHDFNNLLTGILGNASHALLDIPPDSPARVSIGQIERAAERATELTRQMLAYAGKGKFNVGPVDLSALVSEMSRLLEITLSKRATLRCEIEPNLPPIIADATQIRQIVMNLITNAAEALGDESGLVRVATGTTALEPTPPDVRSTSDTVAPRQAVFLEVSDTGCGMDEETRGRMFEPFFTTKFTGRGLGLSAVLGIVRSHSGTLDIESEPGCGTTVRIAFPAAEGSVPAEPPVSKAREDRNERGTVLVVDDEDTVRGLARRVLERSGFSVIEAPDGQAALAIFTEKMDEINAVLLDMTMPRMGGEEAFRQMRSLHPGAQVVLMSGHSEQQAMSPFLDKGPVGFLQKPFRPSELLDLIREAIGQSSPD